MRIRLQQNVSLKKEKISIVGVVAISVGNNNTFSILVNSFSSFFSLIHSKY